MAADCVWETGGGRQCALRARADLKAGEESSARGLVPPPHRPAVSSPARAELSGWSLPPPPLPGPLPPNGGEGPREFPPRFTPLAQAIAPDHGRNPDLRSLRRSGKMHDRRPDAFVPRERAPTLGDRRSRGKACGELFSGRGDRRGPALSRSHASSRNGSFLPPDSRGQLANGRTGPVSLAGRAGPRAPLTAAKERFHRTA